METQWEQLRGKPLYKTFKTPFPTEQDTGAMGKAPVAVLDKHPVVLGKYLTATVQGKHMTW
eukprot:1161915-Pelagomonas_calceolata.AAC.10